MRGEKSPVGISVWGSVNVTESGDEVAGQANGGTASAANCLCDDTVEHGGSLLALAKTPYCEDSQAKRRARVTIGTMKRMLCSEETGQPMR